MLDKDINFEKIILDGLNKFRFRDQYYWCPEDDFNFVEEDEDLYDPQLRLMELVSTNKKEDALAILLITSAFNNWNAAFKVYDEGWTWDKFIESEKEDFSEYLSSINFKGKGRIKPKPMVVELMYSYIDFIGSSQDQFFNNILNQEKSYFRAYDRIFDELTNNVKYLGGEFILPMFLDKIWQFYLFPIIPTEKVATNSKLANIGIKFALGVDVGSNKQLGYNLIKEVAEKGYCLPIYARWGVEYIGEKIKDDKGFTFGDVKRRSPKKLLKDDEPLEYFEEQVTKSFKTPVTEHSLYWNLHVGKCAFANNQKLNNSIKDLYTLIMRLVCEQDRENATFLIFIHTISYFNPDLPYKMFVDGWTWNKFNISKDDEFKKYLENQGYFENIDEILKYKEYINGSQERYFLNIISEEKNYFKVYDRLFENLGDFLDKDYIVPAFLDALSQFKVYPILPTEKIPVNKIALEKIRLQFQDDEINSANDVRMAILHNLPGIEDTEYLWNEYGEENKENIIYEEEGDLTEEDGIDNKDVLDEGDGIDNEDDEISYLLPIEISRGICFDENKFSLSIESDKQIKDSTYISKQEPSKIKQHRYQESKMMKVNPYEKHVEDVLEDKPFLLEDGLEFIDRQYTTSNGIIDLILRDKEGKLVVAEIKRGTANDETLTQLLNYMDVIDNYFDAKDVRGMIVCEEYGPRLKNAVNLLVRKGQDIKLVEYKSEIGFTTSQ
jgi:hypothetical protein